MLWITAAPFFAGRTTDWIPRHLESGTPHAFVYVPAGYAHDRSRETTSGRQWLDYSMHALRAWFSAAPWRSQVGHISAFPQLPVMLGLIKRLSGSRRPIVAWMFNLGRTYDGVKGRLARFALQAVDVFVVHSRAEIETYSRWLGVPRERFVFVPLAVRTLARAHAPDDADPFIFAMGSAHRDYALLFAAVERLGYRTVVVAGPHAVRDLPLPSNVTVMAGLGLADCHRLSQQARVNVVPIANGVTASGQVTLLETLMYGNAVVATACVGTEDYVEDGRTALLAPPRDAGALAAAIDRLWRDAGLRARLGQAGRDYVLAHASFAGVAQVMRQILDRTARIAPGQGA